MDISTQSMGSASWTIGNAGTETLMETLLSARVRGGTQKFTRLSKKQYAIDLGFLEVNEAGAGFTGRYAWNQTFGDGQTCTVRSQHLAARTVWQNMNIFQHA